MKTFPIYCLLLLLVLNVSSYAQSNANKNKLKKALKEAETYLQLEEYHYVEEEMLEAVKYAPENVLCNYYLGISIYNDLTKNRVDALPYFQTVYDQDPSFRQVGYWLGKAYQMGHQFTRAGEMYTLEKQKMSSLKPEEKTEEEKNPGYVKVSVEDLDRYIDQCRRGPEFMANADNKNLLNLSLANTYLPDITPIITVDGQRLYFTSHRQDITSHHELDPHDQLPYQDVFYMDRREDGFWSTPKPMTEINTEEHDAAIALSSDGDRLFLYRSVGASTSNPGDIYEANDYSGKWTRPRPIDAPINSSALETHMSMSADGKVIVFTSDRVQDEAQGGMDLYIIRQLPNGEWAMPQNMGDKINTNLDEESPYIHPNGKTLYFSSQGHNSIGGFDVFKVDIDLKTGDMGEVIQLNYPVNTASDDLFYVMSADGSESYFSSVREEGMGGYDIYCVKNNESNARSVSFFDLKFETEDRRNVDVLVKLINVRTQEVEKEQVLKANRERLEWMHRCSGKYALEVYSKGYLLKTDRFDFAKINKPTVTIEETYRLQKFAVNRSESLMNIYFDDDQIINMSSSSSELKALKTFIEEHDDYSVEIVGHSDYNPEKSKLVLEFMSKTKAMETLNALKTVGIDDEQLVNENVGYGIRYPMYLPESDMSWKNERMEYIIRPKGYARLASRASDCGMSKYDTSTYVLKETEVMSDVVNVNEKWISHLLSELKQCSYLELVVTSGSTQESLDMSNEIITYFENNGIPRDHLTLQMQKDAELSARLRYKEANDYSGAGTVAVMSSVTDTPANDDAMTVVSPSDETIAGNNTNPETKSALQKASINNSAEDLAFEKEIEDFTIVFPFDSKEFGNSNDATLQRIKDYLNANLTKTLKITGHTDSSGPEIYNQYLGMERAKSVAYFFRNIENPNRIYVDSKGELEPITTNATREGRALNRRIHFKFGIVNTGDAK
ncbi:OmpA family protein [Flammeovirga aprica]|uniref:OmpA family protein n=1 Tax=Flammeovirga aprica JL-4 TaxID=694437 RepID=A0A7X9XBF2_9BACT|nr:OmpA family protein [Flammeovirga aprica]NME70675.1 OmpA family protein [Flammeovirga aprica JL-4]